MNHNFSFIWLPQLALQNLIKSVKFSCNFSNVNGRNKYSIVSGLSTYCTYKHKYPLQLLSQGYNLASHTEYVVPINYIRERRDLQFKVIFENLFMAILFTLRVFASNLLIGNHQRNSFCILF